MKKRYEARGMMEWHPLLSAGKTRVLIPFTGGHLSGYGVTPASFETSDPVVQTLIERSPYFRTGRIRLAAAIAAPEPAPPVRKLFPSLGAAADWISAETGTPSSRLLTEAQCVKEAAAIGVVIEIAPSADSRKGGLK